jgi:deoxyribonuclease IV
MLPDGRRIGPHAALGAGMAKAVERAAAIGASTIQVFSDNPTAWRRRADLPRELPAFRARVAERDLHPLAIHAAYLVNLAGPDPDFFDRSCTVLAAELRMARAYGARFVNVHIGSHRGAGADAGAARVAEGIRRVLEAVEGTEAGLDDAADGAEAPILVLENGAGGGWGLGATLEELRLVDEAVDAAGVDRSRVGYCLDTAHLWGAGYAVDTAAGVDEVVAGFDRAIGLHRLRMVHFNDSRAELGSKTDRHEHLGAGRIGTAGLGRFLTHPGLAHVAYYLETPGMDEGYDAVNLARALDLAAGRPLGPLPPEAFELRSPRSRSAPSADPR